MTDWLVVGGRFVHLAAAMLLAGWSLFVLVVGCPPLPRWLSRTAALAAFISAVEWLMAVAALMSEQPLAAVDFATVRLVLDATAFGAVWQFQLSLAAALAVCSWWSGRGRIVLVFVLATSLLAGAAAVGHAGMPGGSASLVRTTNNALHVFAGAAWLGGLLPLELLLRQAAGGKAPMPAMLTAVERFSTLAMAAVAALLLTGAANAGWLLGSPAGLASDWGRLLAFKLALVTGLLMLAATNRFVLLPRLRRRTPADWSATVVALRRSVILELGLAIGVLVAASRLGSLPPPIP